MRQSLSPFAFLLGFRAGMKWLFFLNIYKETLVGGVCLCLRCRVLERKGGRKEVDIVSPEINVR